MTKGMRYAPADSLTGRRAISAKGGRLVTDSTQQGPHAQHNAEVELNRMRKQAEKKKRREHGQQRENKRASTDSE